MSKLLKNQAALFVLSLSMVTVVFSSSAEAKRRFHREDDRREDTRRPNQPPAAVTAPSAQGASNDSDLVRAVNDRRDVNFLEAAQVTVSKILPDDTQGLPHERWYVRLSNGQEVLCVYNLDTGKKIPLTIGSVISIAGEFKWTRQGALMHWLHEDTRDRRPDGYVLLNGVRYGGH